MRGKENQPVSLNLSGKIWLLSFFLSVCCWLLCHSRLNFKRDLEFSYQVWFGKEDLGSIEDRIGSQERIKIVEISKSKVADQAWDTFVSSYTLRLQPVQNYLQYIYLEPSAKIYPYVRLPKKCQSAENQNHFAVAKDNQIISPVYDMTLNMSFGPVDCACGCMAPNNQRKIGNLVQNKFGPK